MAAANDNACQAKESCMSSVYRSLPHIAKVNASGYDAQMAKLKVPARGPWQRTGMQEARIPKGDPDKLRMRATRLKLKAEGLLREADELILRAEEIEQTLKH